MLLPIKNGAIPSKPKDVSFSRCQSRFKNISNEFIKSVLKEGGVLLVDSVEEFVKEVSLFYVLELYLGAFVRIIAIVNFENGLFIYIYETDGIQGDEGKEPHGVELEANDAVLGNDANHIIFYFVLLLLEVEDDTVAEELGHIDGFHHIASLVQDKFIAETLVFTLMIIVLVFLHLKAIAPIPFQSREKFQDFLIL